MCGIIGYTGKEKNAKNVVINGLKNLEYRGYDSAGIAANQNGEINLYKSKGKISNLENNLKQKDIITNCAIGHTRWATHGKPNEKNAHPHKCGNVTLVHNGIIENYLEIKNELLKENISFNSTTDTEVACAYINYIYSSQKDKIQCLINACSKFKGSYAFGIIFDDEVDTIYATRKDSPLIIGLSDDGNFIASDISAILEYTNKYIVLEYNEFAKITKNDVEIFNLNLEKIKKESLIANWSSIEYKKNDFEHFMLKEINEQPNVIKSIYDRYLNSTLLNGFDISSYKSIHIVACGSAMHAGLIGKYFLENYAKIHTTVEIASEYRYKNNLISKDTLVIIISQSGETADSLAALRLAKKEGAYTLAIVNVVGSSIAREADHCIYTYAGPEIAVATTKGYTSQVAILSALTLDIIKHKNLLNNKEIENIHNELKIVDKYIENVINKDNEYKDVAKKIYEKNDLFFIGRGIDSAICAEGSLKLKEISYMHSEAYAAGELKHGTISLIEDSTPVIAISSDKNLYEKIVSNIKETKARGSFVIFISNNIQKETNTNDFADISISIQNSSCFIEPILIVISLQLIAYHTAKLRGCDIDKPKNLAKSVTVE